MPEEINTTFVEETGLGPELSKRFVKTTLTVFGSRKDPDGVHAKFEPSVGLSEASDQELLPLLRDALATGIEISEAVIEKNRPHMTLEKPLTMFQRALSVTNEDRRNASSLIEATDLLCDLAVDLAEAEYTDRMSELYEQENRKSPIWLGDKVLGREVVLGGVGGDDIRQYREDFRKHATAVRDFIVAQFGGE